MGDSSQIHLVKMVVCNKFIIPIILNGLRLFENQGFKYINSVKGTRIESLQEGEGLLFKFIFIYFMFCILLISPLIFLAHITCKNSLHYNKER